MTLQPLVNSGLEEFRVSYLTSAASFGRTFCKLYSGSQTMLSNDRAEQRIESMLPSHRTLHRQSKSCPHAYTSTVLISAHYDVLRYQLIDTIPLIRPTSWRLNLHSVDAHCARPGLLGTLVRPYKVDTVSILVAEYYLGIW